MTTLRAMLEPFFLCTKIVIENDVHSKVLYKGSMDKVPQKFLDMFCVDAFIDGALYVAVRKEA